VVHGIVNYVKNYCHLDALELLSISGTGQIVRNVVYVVVLLVLSGNLLMVDGFMPFVQRLIFCFDPSMANS
jgi:hypothetical protein